MEADQIYTELNTQLENIAKRLSVIEGKLDAQAERDHNHELKIQRLELALDMDIAGFKKSNLDSIEKINKDLSSLGKKVRVIEDRPDKKKAGMVNKFFDHTINYIISMILAAVAAYIAIFFGKNK